LKENLSGTENHHFNEFEMTILITALEFFKIIQFILVLLSGSLWRAQESTGEHRRAQ
jgi:hypothetical protein